MLAFLDISDSAIYWLLSSSGCGDNRILPDGYRVIDGVLEVPVPGRVARGIMARGFGAVQADSGAIGRPLHPDSPLHPDRPPHSNIVPLPLPSGEVVPSLATTRTDPLPVAARRRARASIAAAAAAAKTDQDGG